MKQTPLAISGQPYLQRSRRPTQPRWGKVAALYALFVAAYAVLFSVWQVESLPWTVYLLGILIFATCLAPMMRWFGGDRSKLPMFELILLAYAIQFSLPLYTQPNQVAVENRLQILFWDTTAETLLLAELGIMALTIGYYAARRSPMLRYLPRIDLPMAPERRSLYMTLALCGGGILTFLNAAGWAPLQVPTMSAVVRVLTNQFALAIILLAYDVYGQPRAGLGKSIALYVSTAVACFSGLLTGMLENALVPLVYLWLVRWQAKGRFPWVLLWMSVLLYLILNPAKFDYRNRIWYGTENAGLVDRVQAWTTAVRGNANVGSDDISRILADERIMGALARFDLIHKFVWVREMTPRYVPFYRGQTYSYFLVAWVPRAVWPDKPSASEANHRVDVDYGFLSDFQTTSTNIGIGQLAESYANFGIAGVMTIMAVLGVVFALLDNILNGRHSDGGRAIYLSLMVYFLNGIGSSTAVHFGALVQQTLANALIMRLFATGFRAHYSSSIPASNGGPVRIRKRT